MLSFKWLLKISLDYSQQIEQLKNLNTSYSTAGMETSPFSTQFD